MMVEKLHTLPIAGSSCPFQSGLKGPGSGSIVCRQVSGATTASYVAKYGIAFPVIPDASGKLARAMSVTGYPETFFVRVDGTVNWKLIGPPSSLDYLRAGFEGAHLKLPTSAH